MKWECPSCGFASDEYVDNICMCGHQTRTIPMETEETEGNMASHLGTQSLHLAVDHSSDNGVRALTKQERHLIRIGRIGHIGHYSLFAWLGWLLVVGMATDNLREGEAIYVWIVGTCVVSLGLLVVFAPWIALRLASISKLKLAYTTVIVPQLIVYLPVLFTVIYETVN